MESSLEDKVRMQARRLVEQQQQLQAALAYGKLCEQRIAQLLPGHALPLTPDAVQPSAEPSAPLVPPEPAEAPSTELPLEFACPYHY